MHLNVFGLPGGVVFPAPVLERTDQFLFLGVHGDHRLGGRDVFGDLPGQVPELRVSVFMLATLGDLGDWPCKEKPWARSIRATVRSETGWPSSVSAPAWFFVDYV